MNRDFHYYATYCAAYLAGYSHEESLDICYSAQFVDLCSRTLIGKLKGPKSAATTQLQLELMDAGSDPRSLQMITRIWSSFHFLPRDLGAEKKGCGKGYLNKYRLICGPNGDLLVDTVKLAKGKGLQAAGIAMHVLADTWAHRNFAGTPSLVINNTDHRFEELVPVEPDDGTDAASQVDDSGRAAADANDGTRTDDGGRYLRRPVTFKHSVSMGDDIEKGVYINSVFQISENSIMNLGHGRAGHLPDYGFARYAYVPAWSDYEEVIKDNPSDYLHAFCQMVYALEYLHGDRENFEKDRYNAKATLPWKKEINKAICTRQPDASADWKALGEKLSGCEIEDFDIEKYQLEYYDATEESKDDTFLGRFFLAAMEHKSMITSRIYNSGNIIAGLSVDFEKKGFKGMRDYRKLVEQRKKEADK